MKRKLNTCGFTLIEVLFSLSICIVIIVSTTMILSTYKNKEILDTRNANMELGIKALSQDIFTAKELQYGEQLQYVNDVNERCQISLDNKGRIIRTPGHVIYMHDINTLSFYKEQNRIYAKIRKGDIERIVCIGTDYQIIENIYEE